MCTRKFEVDLLFWKHGQTKSFRKIDQSFKLNISKFSKDLNMNNTFHKSKLNLFRKKKCFKFAILDNWGRVIGHGDALAKQLKILCWEYAKKMWLAQHYISVELSFQRTTSMGNDKMASQYPGKISEASWCCHFIFFQRIKCMTGTLLLKSLSSSGQREQKRPEGAL